MSKTSAISSAAAKPAPPPANKADSKPAPAKKTASKAKDTPKIDGAVAQEKTLPTPPSDDSKLSSLSHSSSLNDSFSYSNEGYGSRKVTTESTTRLVDSLVETYTGEYSGVESHDHSSFDRDTPSRMNSSYSEHGHDCPHSPGTSKERFQRLDEAGQQISQAQQNVERVMDRAVEARVYNEKPVPASDEKRAEEEYERLTKAEGRLHRTKQTLAEKQEFRRQRKLEYGTQRQSAENALLSKFGNASSALRDHMMETFRPLIAKDDQARNDHKQLEAAAEWHLKSDSEAARLAKESTVPEADQKPHPVEEDSPDKTLEPSRKGPSETTLADRDKQARRQEEEQKVKLKTREESKRKKLEGRVEREAFKESVRNASAQERTHLVESELGKLDETTSTHHRQELEAKLNEQLGQVQTEETRTSNKEDDKRRSAVNTLLETKSQRAGKGGQALDPLSQAVEELDDESVRKTHKKLEDMDLNSMDSVLDLERAFGRNISDVKADLEQQVHRGGKSVSKARQTLTKLDKVTRRSRLLSEANSWDALLQCIAPSGPRLGGFLGLPDGWTGRQQGAPAFQNSSGVDSMGARRLARRLVRSGGKVDERRQTEALNRLGFVG